eukprot:TRINITY_DN3328_c0_g1_i3.p1 TRINITY_DN3328_c0_g1~~TRINITY_DN3328_c0_g1_i3.p1  ORF type:complete len:455 (-),score=105.07 TRINITY_DN3328_c0_g1_i3:419-1783(-)
MTLDECYADLPNAGDSIIEHYKKVDVMGITGRMTVDENLDRPMNQVMFQWTGDSYETSAIWNPYPEGPRINHELGKTTQGYFEWKIPPKYASQDGIAPKTIQLSHLSNVWTIVCLILMVLSIVVAGLFVYLQKSDQRQLMKSRNFFNSGLVFLTIFIVTVVLFIDLTNGMLIISPSSSMVPLTVFLQFFDWIPLITILSLICSRLYRFHKVTNNKKMRSIKFGKHHSLKLCLVTIAIPLPFFVYWIFRSVDKAGSFTDLFERLFTLQSLFDWLEKRDDMSIEMQEMSFVGFDNIRHNVTFDQLQAQAVTKILTATIAYTIFMSVIFICSLKHQWKLLIKGTGAATTTMGSTLNQSNAGSTSNGVHALSSELLSRLQIASFNTVDGTVGDTVDGASLIFPKTGSTGADGRVTSNQAYSQSRVVSTNARNGSRIISSGGVMLKNAGSLTVKHDDSL